MKKFETEKIEISLNMKAFSVFVFTCAIMLAFFRPAYSVYLNGNRIAVVADKSQFENVLKKVNTQISELIGENGILTEKPQYLFKIVLRNSYTPESEITDKLMSIPGNIIKCCEITADGKTVAYAESKTEAEKILKSVVNSYDGYDKKLLTKVKYKDKYILNFNLYNDSGIYNALKNNVEVESKEDEEIETDTPFEVVKRENPELKSGKTNVVREGIPGKDMVKHVYTLVNGVRESENIVSKTVILKSTAEILEVGTKQIMGIGSGILATPVSVGRISSEFGARGDRRTAHKGVDIACTSGTPVAAADEGICVTAEYRNDYGNLIILDHQNGFKTYYAHLSRIDTTVGEIVEKGQIIGETGNTGISTGPHIHFEVRENDVPCDPSEFVTLMTAEQL